LNFYVIFEDGRAGLGHFVPATIFLFGETETVGSNDHAVLENNAITDAAVFADNGM